MESQDKTPATDSYQDALRVVQSLIDTVRGKIETRNSTVADFCRLLHLQLELKDGLEANTTKEVNVKWVGPPLTGSASER